METTNPTADLETAEPRAKDDGVRQPPPSRGAEADPAVTRPVIVDLGKARGKQVKRLKRGRGKLWDEVLDVCDEVSYQLGEEAEGKVLVPVVMVYRKKRKKQVVNPLFPLVR
jgi:hypothetical protein